MSLHATAIAAMTASGWRAVLLRGPSGSGKSDLALRLLGHGGWRLIGDDQVQVWCSGGHLYAAPAQRLEGAIEVRGLGLMATPCLGLARVSLIADCGQTPERLPDPRHDTILGVALPLLALSALESSAPAKLKWALTGRDVLSRLEP